jgi:ferritin
MPVKSLLDPSTEILLEEAISQEIHASHLYKHLANQCQRLGLLGAAKYFLAESAEELTHYQKIADYVNDRGSVAFIPDIPAVTLPIKSLNDALLAAYNAEVALGQKYEQWYGMLCSSDVTTAQFLLQYLEIQRISIGDYGDLLARIDMVGADRAAILIIDSELGD